MSKLKEASAGVDSALKAFRNAKGVKDIRRTGEALIKARQHLYTLSKVKVKVSSEPADDTDAPDTDVAPDVAPSALTGTTNPSIADALGTTKPEMAQDGNRTGLPRQPPVN